MSHATEFTRQWAGIVALVRLFGAHAPRAKLIEGDGMVASVMPAAPTSSLMNVALSVDPTAPPTNIRRLKAAFRAAGAQKWGLWVDGADAAAAEAATSHGLVLDSCPAAMVANLDGLPFDDAPPNATPDLATVGRINDAAYGYDAPKLAPAIASLPRTVIAYGASYERHHGLRRHGARRRQRHCGLVRRDAPPGAAKRPRRRDSQAPVARRARARADHGEPPGEPERTSAVRATRLHDSRLAAPLRGAVLTRASLNPALREARFCPRCAQPAEIAYPRS